MKSVITVELGGKQISLETGRLAKQADGSVLASCGNNVVLVTVVSSRKETDFDFFPMTVEYAEKFYSTGKIPGGYFKREGRPTNEATLKARLIDRPLRPLFPEGYRFETQIVAMVLSSDNGFPLEVLASLGASASVHLSDIPFNGPAATVVVGRAQGQWVINPSAEQLLTSEAEITIGGTRNGLLMVEGECQFLSESDVLNALQFAHEHIIRLIDAQDDLLKKVGSKKKREFSASSIEADFRTRAEAFLRPKLSEALHIREKLKRYEKFDQVKEQAVLEFISPNETSESCQQKKKELAHLVEEIKYQAARQMILSEKVRIDGRDVKTVRPIECEVGLLPRAHGSGLFTRGETQVLAAVTLGTGDDEQSVDAIGGVIKKQFFLHYNFPPFSVGEVGRLGGQSRREIGHGFLAERALQKVLPSHDEFPYTLRIVSEVLESNGSSSMGTVCSGTLSLLDAGVPIKGNVAGIAMGLIKEGHDVAILSDILGDEDHLGDMDFKVAGTSQGITALQMDIKIDQIGFDIMERALHQAKEGRLHILGEMEKVMRQPRGSISEFAPRIETIKIRPEKVREIIGPGGKVVKSIIEETGVKIDIEDDGTIHVASSNPKSTERALEMIRAICEEAEVGRIYKGKVVRITPYGAFVEILPNTMGLLHISEIAHERIRNVEDVLSEGEVVEVKVLDIDRDGRVKLSRKATL